MHDSWVACRRNILVNSQSLTFSDSIKQLFACVESSMCQTSRCAHQGPCSGQPYAAARTGADTRVFAVMLRCQ